MSFFKNGVLVENVLEIDLSSTANVVFTNSTEKRIYVTGTTVSSTFTLPDATTLAVGRSFEIINDSDVEITVNYNGGSNAGNVEPNTSRIFTFLNNSTSTGAVNSSQTSSQGIVEVNSVDDAPDTGLIRTVYVAKDSNKIYRWDTEGDVPSYVELNKGIRFYREEKILNSDQIISGVIPLDKTPDNPSNVRLVPKHGIEQDYGDDFIVSGNELIFKDLGLDGFLEENEPVYIYYTAF